MTRADAFWPSVPFSWTDEISRKLYNSNFRITSSTFLVLFTIIREVKLSGSCNDIKLSHTTYGHLPITAYTFNKVLLQLKNAGVIKLSVKSGRSPIIDLLVKPSNKSTEVQL